VSKKDTKKIARFLLTNLHFLKNRVIFFVYLIKHYAAEAMAG